jgi:opacity protein-like surface antigen
VEGINPYGPLRNALREIRSRAWLGLVILTLAPWPGYADDQRTDGRRFRLLDAALVSAAPDARAEPVIASPTPESVLMAQAGGSRPGASVGDWRFTLALSVWAPRTEIDLTVGHLSQSATLNFSDIVEDLRFGFTGHFEATWREWSGLLEVFYFKVEKDETTGAGVPTEVDFQQMFVEFGGTYRLATLPLGGRGQITFEALAGGRLTYVEAELSVGTPTRSRSTPLIDPMFGGRIAYRITDTVALWFRGDVAGFGISNSQSQLTYNLIAGLNWRFTHAGSVFAGWRYMRVKIEEGSGASTLDVDVSMNGPVLGINFYF